MTNIEQLVEVFRNAIDEAKFDECFEKNDSFYHFPRGCCGDTCDLLAQFLLENGIRTYYICGSYYSNSIENGQTHAWLMTDNNIIIDITGDQFKDKSEFLNYKEHVYVGEIDDFHKLFEVNKRNIHEENGLVTLGSVCQPRLFKLYKMIKEHMQL